MKNMAYGRCGQLEKERKGSEKSVSLAGLGDEFFFPRWLHRSPDSRESCRGSGLGKHLEKAASNPEEGTLFVMAKAVFIFHIGLMPPWPWNNCTFNIVILYSSQPGFSQILLNVKLYFLCLASFLLIDLEQVWLFLHTMILYFFGDSN